MNKKIKIIFISILLLLCIAAYSCGNAIGEHIWDNFLEEAE